MKVGVAAAIVTETVLEIVPGQNCVHRFVLDEFLQKRRRRFPGDAFQIEKADIEPGGEQRMNVGIQRLQAYVFRREQHQLGAQVHQKLHALTELVELAQELDPRGHQDLAQVALGVSPLGFVTGFLAHLYGSIHSARIHVVVPGQNLEEAPSPFWVECQIGLAQLRCPGPGRYLAAPGFQTGVDLLAQTTGVGIR